MNQHAESSSGGQNGGADLLALHRAALDLYGHSDLALDAVLQRVVDQARALLGARYGALSVLGPQPGIRLFLTSGMSASDREKVGAPPIGKGLLGVPLMEGQRLRIDDISQDLRSVGFPPNHPAMRSLLAVPVTCRSHYRGNLYLCDRVGAEPKWRPDDEETLVRYATLAAVAIDSAEVHEQLAVLAVAEERVRIAREMHDGMAQVLAYVNTKAQAVREFLRRGAVERAGEQLDQLAEAARGVAVDVREGILALRTEISPDCRFPVAVRSFVRGWERQGGIRAEVDLPADVGLTLSAELQALRIVQEALSNVRKHSGATFARVTARPSGNGRVVIEIADDGAGFDPDRLTRADIPRFGLAIMKERALSIGATLSVESSPGDGTRVVLDAPRVPGEFDADLDR
jgi:signal transduction histidine kinase